jgi:hypothetical protein
MSEQRVKEGFVFTIVQDNGENVTIEVSEEDYQRERAAGVDEESLLKPGRYKTKRGGFLARHAELKIKERLLGSILNLISPGGISCRYRSRCLFLLDCY